MLGAGARQRALASWRSLVSRIRMRTHMYNHACTTDPEGVHGGAQEDPGSRGRQGAAGQTLSASVLPAEAAAAAGSDWTQSAAAATGSDAAGVWRQRCHLMLLCVQLTWFGRAAAIAAARVGWMERLVRFVLQQRFVFISHRFHCHACCST